MNEHSNGYEQEEDAHGSEKGVATGHAKREDSTEAEASAEAEGQESASHDQPFTGDAGEATGEPLTV